MQSHDRRGSRRRRSTDGPWSLRSQLRRTRALPGLDRFESSGAIRMQLVPRQMAGAASDGGCGSTRSPSTALLGRSSPYQLGPSSPPSLRRADGNSAPSQGGVAIAPQVYLDRPHIAPTDRGITCSGEVITIPSCAIGAGAHHPQHRGLGHGPSSASGPGTPQH